MISNKDRSAEQLHMKLQQVRRSCPMRSCAREPRVRSGNSGFINGGGGWSSTASRTWPMRKVIEALRHRRKGMPKYVAISMRTVTMLGQSALQGGGDHFATGRSRADEDVAEPEETRSCCPASGSLNLTHGASRCSTRRRAAVCNCWRNLTSKA